MIFVSLLMAGVALWLLLPTLSDAISLAALAVQRMLDGGRAESTSHEPGRFLFLVPAHDEEVGIRSCVSSLLEMDYPSDRRTVVVVADNCSDRTAESAKAAGAHVMVRTDSELRGKPRALAWAIQRLDLAGYDAVVIIDADVLVDDKLAWHLGRKGPWKGRAGQVYDGVSNPTENALTRMAVVFSNLRYHLSFPLKEATGLNVPLQGNGMVFGADLLAKRGWDAFSICEDWEMYALLTLDGVQIVGCPQARALAQEASSLEQSNSQRKRWAAGKMTLLAQYFGSVVKARLSLRQKLDLMAELGHIGPAAHLALVVTLSTVVGFAGLPWASWLQWALWIPILRVGVYTLLALRLEEKPLRALASFIVLPFYAVWRLVIQVTSLTMLGNKRWVRTQRGT